jgi:hypothetical protein
MLVNGSIGSEKRNFATQNSSIKTKTMKTEILKLKNLCNEIKTWAYHNSRNNTYRSAMSEITVYFRDSGDVDDVWLRRGDTVFMVNYKEVVDWLASPPVTAVFDRITMSADFIADDSLLDKFHDHFSKLFAEIKVNETERLRAEAEEKKQASIKELERKLSILKGERKEHSLLEK